MIEKDNTKRFWNKIADETKLGDRTSVGMLADVDNFNSIYRKRIEEEHFLRLARLTKSSAVLELGCGGGRWAFFIGQYVSSVTAVDFSPSMINLAKEEQRARKIDNIQFETSDIENFKTILFNVDMIVIDGEWRVFGVTAADDRSDGYQECQDLFDTLEK